MTVQDQLFLRKHNQIERKYAKLFNRVLANQYRQLAGLYSNGMSLDQLDTQPMQRLYRRMYLDVMRIEGFATWMEYVFPLTGERVRKKDLVDGIASDLAPQETEQLQGFWANLMDTYLNIYIVQRVREVSLTTIRRVRDLIERSKAESLDNSQIEKAIRKEAREQQLRANTISRTETTNSISKSQVITLESSKLGFEKAWKHVRDNRVRDTHKFMDADLYIPVRDNFTVGDSQMAYPGDSTQGAPMKETVNCRCYLKYRKAGVLPGRVGFRPVRITEQYIQESQ